MTTHVNFTLAANSVSGVSISAVPGEPAPGAPLSGPSYFEVPTVLGSRIVYGALYVRPGETKGAAVIGGKAALIVQGPSPSLTLANVNAASVAAPNSGRKSRYSSNTADGGGIEGNASPISASTTSITFQQQIKTRRPVSPSRVSNQLAPAPGGPEGLENVVWTAVGASVSVASGASAVLPVLGPDQRIVIVEGAAFTSGSY